MKSEERGGLPPGSRGFVLVACLVSLLGCAMHPPYINSIYTGQWAPPTAKPDSATVEVYRDTSAPDRVYTTVGRVVIASDNRKQTLESMLDYARAEARKMGGDALVNVKTSESFDSADWRLLLPHQQIGAQTTVKGPLHHRAIIADVVVWKTPHAVE